MSRKQSRRRQRQIEDELFGKEDRQTYSRPRPPLPPLSVKPQIPGNCAFCGNCCWPAYEPWTCPDCGVIYEVKEEA